MLYLQPIMGCYKLWLLLVLSSYSLAQEGNTEQTCALAIRLKAYKKYVYQYTTESRNGIVGTANGPKVSCQVEIEVPQPCRFIMSTRDCSLSEVSAISPEGNPVFVKASRSDDFHAAMNKNPLMFTVNEITDVQLYPKADELINILNVKRGIISALVVPMIEDQQRSFMSTVHGLCSTEHLVNARMDIATDVTLSRDLSQCDQFYSRELVSSPLAVLQRLHQPMSKLITSTQSCNYHFHNEGKYVTAAVCTEKHIYLPFSHEGNGISSEVIQGLSFRGSKRINNRVFDVKQRQSKPLHFEEQEDKAGVQTKDRVLSTLQDLMALPGTDQDQSRTSLFYKLVSSLRLLRNDTLSSIVTEMSHASHWLTWQALLQCGTPECTSAILQSIRTLDGVSMEVDALVYGLSLQANPDASRVRDMLSMAQYKQSKTIMYAVANTVKRFYKGGVSPVVTEVAEFMETLLNNCSGPNNDDESDFASDPDELSFLVLRVVGVMGQALQAVSPSLISTILQCIEKTDIPLSNQKAAIQAFRLMDVNDEVKKVLMEVYQAAQCHVEKRIAAYMILMRNPEDALVRDIVTSLQNVRDEQLKSFVVSHMNNMLKSDKKEMNHLRKYSKALNDQVSSANKAFDYKSRNYKMESPFGSVQSNIIFDEMNTLPKEVMLETTFNVFDFNYDIFEVGIEGTGFEPKIAALFGRNGFFPDFISKVLYWAGGKAQMLRGVWDKMAPNNDKLKEQVPQDILKDIMKSFEKLMSDIRLSQAPEAIAYLRLLGNEIGYMKASEMRKVAETLFTYYHIFIRILPAQAFFDLTSSTENEVFAHYIFMENAFSLPTASGLPLRFSLTGVFAPGAKGGLTYSFANTDLSFMPSVGLEFITQIGVHIPDYVEAGLEMHTNVYHESSINAKVTMKKNQITLSIPAPKSNTQLFSISNNVLSVSSGQTRIVPALGGNHIDSTDCQVLFSGLNLCIIMRYSNVASFDRTPYYPLTGQTRFAVEIQPLGEVLEYTATITSEKFREGKKGRNKIESLMVTLKAEGTVL